MSVGSRLRCFVVLGVSIVLSTASPLAVADNPLSHSPDRPVNLRVRHMPAPAGITTLRIRAQVEPSTADESAAAASSSVSESVASSSAEPTATVETQTSARPAGYEAVPGSWRDAEERVIFKFNVGYGLDTAPTSGAESTTGTLPGQLRAADGSRLQESRQYLLGDAVLGSRGVLQPSLNTYFLSHYQLNNNGASRFATLNNVYDADDGDALVVHSAYAEIDGMGEEGTVQHDLFVRAGRQYHYGTTMFITHFDGIQAGYDSDKFEVNGHIGQRVVLHDRRSDLMANTQIAETSPGLLGGAGIKLRGRELVDLPVDVNIDYMFYGGSGAVDELLNTSRHYIEMSSRIKLPRETRLYLKARLAANGEHCDGRVSEDSNGALRCDGFVAETPGRVRDDGLGLGRLGAQLRKPFGRRLLLVADVEQIFSGEVAYDYISPRAVDVVNVARELGIGLGERKNTTRAGARVTAMISDVTELHAFSRADLVTGDTTSGFDSSYEEFGVALAAKLGSALTLLGQGKLRIHQLDDTANEAGELFFNTAGSGVNSFSELSSEARYSPGFRKFTTSLGAYLRSYSIETPYFEIAGDTRAGARIRGDYWLRKRVRLHGAGEFAQASPALAPDVGTLFSMRLMMEAIF